MVSRRLQPGYDYLVHRKLSSLWHQLTDSCLQPDLDQFISAALELGFTERVTSAIGSQIIARLLIQTARPLTDLRESDLQELLHACDFARYVPDAAPNTIAAPPIVPARFCFTSAFSTHKHRQRSQH